jgi:hypothetical protein
MRVPDPDAGPPPAFVEMRAGIVAKFYALGCAASRLDGDVGDPPGLTAGSII